MKNGITYGKLFGRLKKTGYLEKRVEFEGTKQMVFTHPRHESAIILLPDNPREDPVLPIHLSAVRTILESHGVISSNEDSVGI